MINNYSSHPITIRQITSTEEFRELELEWSTLFQHNIIQTAFLTWEWLFSWWQIYGINKELWLITAYQNYKLVGIAPLMLEERIKYKIKHRIICSLGTPQIDIGGFIMSKRPQLIIAAISEFLIEKKHCWDLVEFNQFQENKSEIQYLAPYFKKADYQISQKSNLHFYIYIEKDWETFFSQFSQNLRGDLRRRLRRIKEYGKITFVHHSGSEVTWDDINTMFQINEYGHYPLLYHSQKEVAFQRELFGAMKNKGWLDVFLLFLDDHPIAYRYGFTLNNKYEDWRNGFDTRHKKHAPGKVLLLLTLQESAKQGYNIIDFLRGEEEYKMRLPSHVNRHIKLRLAASKKLTTTISYIWVPILRGNIKKIKVNLKDIFISTHKFLLRLRRFQT